MREKIVRSKKNKRLIWQNQKTQKTMEWLMNKTKIDTGHEKMNRRILSTGIAALLLFAMFAVAMVPVEARFAPQGVQYDRQAIVNEAYYAVVGGWPYNNEPYVGTGLNDKKIGSFNYLYADMDAYYHTRAAWYVRYPPNGYMTNNGNAVLRQYFLDSDLSRFGLYGGQGRGAQCKYFANLILYSAGVTGVDPFPTYSTMQSQSVSSGYAKPGDVLFRENYHTAIVTKVLKGNPNLGTVTAVRVVDSNWVSSSAGSDQEIIGIHNYDNSNPSSANKLSYYRVWKGTSYYNTMYNPFLGY